MRELAGRADFSGFATLWRSPSPSGRGGLRRRGELPPSRRRTSPAEAPRGAGARAGHLAPFGRIVATATLDTIGVDPRFAGHGFGRALLAQMIENLAALHVERLETEVDPEAFDLSRFLLRSGFAPSQRIAFRKALT